MDSSPNRVAPEGLTPVTEIDLRALSEVMTEKDTFLTVYLTTNIKDFRTFVDGRLKAINKGLPEDLKDAFAQTLDLIEPAIASAAAKGERGRMIFASVSLSPKRFSARLQGWCRAGAAGGLGQLAFCSRWPASGKTTRTMDFCSSTRRSTGCFWSGPEWQSRRRSGQ